MKFITAAAAVLTASLAFAGADSAPERPSETWVEIREATFGDRAIADGAAMIAIDTPMRAHDAALVPVALRIDPGAGRTVKAITLIVDENPAPVAAEFEIGAGLGHIVELSTRVRVNAYSNVRAVVELDDGTLWQAANFVKATGGCAAPALKDMDAAIAAIGQMKLRQFAAAEPAQSSGRHEAQVMIRHPNYSGFQMNQVTQLYIPAHFVDEIAVMQGDELLFRVTGGISLSEDPAIRFTYIRNGAGELGVEATDTEGAVFTDAFAIDPAT